MCCHDVVSIFAGTQGYLDGVAVSDITRFLADFVGEIRANGQDILAAIREDEAVSEETDKKLRAFLGGFAKTFA